MTTGERLRSYWGERQIGRERLASQAARYWEIGLFAALIGLALGLRLWDLGGRAIHHDESLHMYYAWQIFRGDGYEHIPFMHGPFQYFGSALVFLLWPFGDTDFSARLLYALFGSALVGLPFFLRGYLGRAGALVAATLLALSPTLLYFSRFARNDIYVAFFTLALVIVIWRYLKEQKQAYLYAVPLLLMLSFVTKEVTFITTALFLIYLEVQLATDLVDRLRANRPMGPTEVALTYVVLLPTAWLIAALWPLLEGPRKRWSLSALPPAGHLLMIMGTFALPQLAPAVQFLGLGDIDVFDDPGEGNVKVIATLIFVLLSAYVGLLWNPRVWAIGAVIFYVPFFLFYTTFFTNGGDIWNIYTFFTAQGGGLGHAAGEFWRGEGGFWTGIWGSLDYWLSQQLVRRGSQPDYYYLMTLPVYEFLPLVFALGGALYYSFRGKLEQQLLALSALTLVVTFILLPDSTWLIGEYRVQAAFLIVTGAVLLFSMERFTKFLLFWTLAIFFGITIAGEKMPWLTVHLALPIILLAAKVLDDVLSTVGAGAKEAAPEARPARRRRQREEQEEAKEPGIALEPLIPLILGAALALAAAIIFQAVGPAAGISALAWILSLGALGAVLWAGTMVSWRAAGQVAAVALFAALLVFTVRAGAIAAFDEGDPDPEAYPQELFIYAQGSPGLGVIRDEIDRKAAESGRGRDLKIVLDNSEGVNVWPWPWDLRDYRNVEHKNFEGGFAPEAHSVVLIGRSNESEIDPYLDLVEERIEYTHMWWFPELYRGLEVNAFLSDFFRGRFFATWRGYFIDRTVPGATSAPDRIAFFFGEFEPIEPAPVEQPTVEGTLDQESQVIIGGPGSEPGRFSQPADVALDAEGNLYVVDTLNQRVQKFTPDGTFIESFGQSGTGPGEFANPREADENFAADGPWGIEIDQQGNVYVADTWNHRIQKFGPDLEFLLEWGAGELFGPRDIAIDADGNVLVADTGNKRIVEYTPDGEFIQEHGQDGRGPGQLNEPTSVSVAANGDIYVADFWNRRIQHFDPEFRYLDEISVGTWGSRGVTDRAYIVVLPDGRVLATDPANAQILVFDPSGEWRAAWKLTNVASRPVGVVVDGRGRVYISDGLASEVRLLSLTALLP